MTDRTIEPGRADVQPIVLSPHTLLVGLRILGPPLPIAVEGTVEEVRPHPRSGFAYVTLSGGGGSIEARVPLHERPNEHETIRVTGMVRVQPRTIAGGGLSVVLDGRVEGAVPPRARPPVELHKPRRVPLETLLEEHPVQSVLVLGTDRAFSDLASTGLRQQPRFRKVPTVSRAALIDAATNGVREGATGIIFTRGGSTDGSEGLWNDSSFVAELLALPVPFYTAIGHSTSLHLADSYADQAFTTPTHVGAEIRRIVERRAANARAEAELTRLRSRVAELETTPVAAVAHVPKAPQPLVLIRWPKNSSEWGVVAAIILILAFLMLRSLR